MYQPLCPVRRDAKCMGAMCAWSRRVEGGTLVCAVAARQGDAKGLPVIDARKADADPVERT